MWPWKDRVWSDLRKWVWIQTSPGLHNVPLQSSPSSPATSLECSCSHGNISVPTSWEFLLWPLTFPLFRLLMSPLYSEMPYWYILLARLNKYPMCCHGCVLGFSLLSTFREWWFPINASCIFSLTIQQMYTVVGRKQSILFTILEVKEGPW